MIIWLSYNLLWYKSQNAGPSEATICLNGTFFYNIFYLQVIILFKFDLLILVKEKRKGVILGFINFFFFFF